MSQVLVLQLRLTAEASVKWLCQPLLPSGQEQILHPEDHYGLRQYD
uniref:Uncharacterized protein n=1 Tax=Arundo donax TaxID=35708 RepID=A0A0A9EP04_ARUDO